MCGFASDKCTLYPVCSILPCLNHFGKLPWLFCITKTDSFRHHIIQVYFEPCFYIPRCLNGRNSEVGYFRRASVGFRFCFFASLENCCVSFCFCRVAFRHLVLANKVGFSITLVSHHTGVLCVLFPTPCVFHTGMKMRLDMVLM